MVLELGHFGIGKMPSCPPGTMFRLGRVLIMEGLDMLEYLASLDWVAISSQFSAVAIALYGVYKAVVKLVVLLKKRQ